MKSDAKKDAVVFQRDEAGLELLEYAIAAVLIGAGIFSAFTQLGTSRPSNIEVVAYESSEQR